MQENGRTARNPTVFDQGRSHRAKLGFVILATDRTSEADLLRMAPEGVGIHFSRIPMSGAITVGNLMQMKNTITQAAALILPDEGVDVICFHCTAGSLLIGERNVMHALADAGNARMCTTVLSAVMEAFRSLNITRFSLVTPYGQAITSNLVEYFNGAGLSIPRLECMDLSLDSDIARVHPAYIESCAVNADHPLSQALFISCTGLRSIELIASLEHTLGKPVITSTQAAMWHMLRMVGVYPCLAGCGHLLETR